MPIPVSEALEDQETSAITKARAARTSMARYLATSAMAGAYVGVAVVLLVMVSAAFVAAKSPSAKLVQGAVFTLRRSVGSRVIRHVHASLGSFTRMAGPPSCPRAIRSTARADQRRRDAA